MNERTKFKLVSAIIIHQKMQSHINSNHITAQFMSSHYWVFSRNGISFPPLKIQCCKDITFIYLHNVISSNCNAPAMRFKLSFKRREPTCCAKKYALFIQINDMLFYYRGKRDD